MRSWIRPVLAWLAILLMFVAFMFLYPVFYDLLGRVWAMAMWLVLIVLCEMLWNFIIKPAKTSE
jgi:hypothetical protein